MKTLNDNYQIELKLLSPVHVGAGTDKNWQRGVDFVERNGKVYLLNKTKLFSEMSEQLLMSYFKKVSDRNLYNVESLLLDQFDVLKVSTNIFEVQKGVYNEIKALIRDGNNTPYIPGSSLKGAIISALFHYIHSKVGGGIQNRYINNDLLGSFENSIMRYIRISDVPWPLTKITNVSLFNLYQDGSNWISDYKNKFNLSVEHFDDSTDPINFRISIANGLGAFIKQKQGALLPKYYDQIFKGEPIEAIFKWINLFTHAHLQKELTFFKKYDQAEDSGLIIEQIEKLLEEVEQAHNTCILRVASGIGFHAITGDWRFDDHTFTIKQPDRSNLIWNSNTRQKEPSRYKSRKILSTGNDLLMGFVKLKHISI